MATMPRTVDHAQRRTELTAAMWRVVDRGQLEPVTVRDIAAEAGVSVGMVQHYFPSKEELLLFAQQQLRAEFEARLSRKVAALSQPADRLEVLKLFMMERLPLSRKQRTRGRVLLAWLTQVSWRPESDGLVATEQRRACASMAEALRSGQDDGRVLDSLDSDAAAYGLFALNEGLCAGLLNGLHTPASARRVMEAHLALLIPA